jgi:hypothetical protein
LVLPALCFFLLEFLSLRVETAGARAGCRLLGFCFEESGFEGYDEFRLLTLSF